MAFSTLYGAPSRTDGKKSSPNPQVQQFKVSRPLVQLSFQPLRFPSSSVFSPSSCTSLGSAGRGHPQVLHSLSSAHFIYTTHLCIMPRKPLFLHRSFRASRIPAPYSPGWVGRKGLSVSPSAPQEARKRTDSLTLRLNAVFFMKAIISVFLELSWCYVFS